VYIIKEAFQSGSSSKVVQKVVNVVEKRIVQQITVASFPYNYANQYGKFAGYFCAASKKIFRLNFLLGTSDSLYSMDIFGKNSIPKVTVDLDGFNIIQCIEAISEELTGEISESVLKEYTNDDRKKMLFSTWTEEDKDALDNLQNKRLAAVYTQFIKKDTYNKEVNLASFTQLAKQYLFSLGLTNPSFRIRKKGSTEREIVDKAKQDQIQDLVETMAWEKKFKYLESSVEAVVDDRIQSLICYGSPGSGKTETIMNKLKSLGVTPKVFSGGFKNADEVFKLLTKYSNDQILVFDDCDSVMKNLELRNIFKSALQNTKSREITWRDKILDFHSGVIFISNLQKFDPAITSRSMTIEISLSNEQMLSKIESTLRAFMPEVDMKIKKAALDFLKEIQTGVKTVDYREIQKVIIAMQIQPTDWKDFAMLMLSSQ